MAARALWLLSGALGAALGAREADPPAAHDRALPAAGDASCRICHPAATKGLRASPHAALLTDAATADRACSVCHGDQSAHAASAQRAENRLLRAAPVTAQSCKACHADVDWAPSRAVHPWQRPADVEARARALEEAPSIELPAPREGLASFDWSALAAVGYRFVDQSGSTPAYDTDVNLDSGFRLIDAELRGSGSSKLLDLFELRASDLGDPYEIVSGEAAKDGLYRLTGRYAKSRYVYQASGPYHHVDTDNEVASFGLTFDVAADVQVFAEYSHTHHEGFWLTSRVGNRNLSPLTSVGNVQSPRELDADEGAAGVTGQVWDTAFDAAFLYRSDEMNASWTWSQPSSVNPAFTDGEDFTSESTLRGPGVRLGLGRQFGPIDVDLRGRYFDLERTVDGSGTSMGYDVGEFTGQTVSQSQGDAETLLIEGTVTAELAERVELIFDGRWLDHHEDMRIDQTDTVFYPSLGTSTVVPTALDQQTTQRSFDGALELQFEPLDGLVLEAGWGYAQEYLSLPDLEAGDPDVVSGTLRSNGPILGFDWRPDARWTVRGRYTDYRQSGLQLYEITPEEALTAEASVAYRVPEFRVEAFWRTRQSENDSTRFQAESTSYGLNGSLTPSASVDLFLSWVYTDIDSQTLTNFYFDPDPNPVPTFVGFQGTTNTGILGLGIVPAERVLWRTDAAYTETTGSFAVELVDWRTDLSVETWTGGRLGAQFRQVVYDDALGQNDYQANLLLLYWRQTIGGQSRR